MSGSIGKTIVLLAPLPPPANGHSLAAKSVLDVLEERHTVKSVDIGAASTHDGRITWQRLLAVGRALIATWRAQRDADAIYLTVSESVGGNLKDLAIYLLCARGLHRMVIHVHGGSLGREVFERSPLLKHLNALAIRQLRAVIVTGVSHSPIFDGMIDRQRLHVIQNYADDSLFLTEAAIRAKFADRHPMRVLYMSSMMPRKGYELLRDAYLLLAPHQQNRLRIDFAGAFADEGARLRFEKSIAGVPGLNYHGFADFATRAALFARAHVFCLPTTYLEGQPLSIIEAFASGCVVITTGQPGIRDVFTPGVHGWEVAAGSVKSVCDAMGAALDAGDNLTTMAVRSSVEAGVRFRQRRFAEAVLAVVTAHL